MAKKNNKELVEWFENNDLGDYMEEVDKRGDMVICRPGQNPIEAIKRHLDMKKKVPVSMRLTAGVIDKVKKQAAYAGIPWTTFIDAILERAVTEPQSHAAQ